MRKKDANGRIVKWAMELCPFSLDLQSRTTVKSQALVDFIAEWTDLNEPPSPDVSCNTLGVKHALILIKTFISILIKHSIT